jgi:phage terminase large subunit-like protein
VTLALVDRVRALPDAAIVDLLAGATAEELAALRFSFREFWLRPDERAPGAVVGSGQIRPPGDALWWVLQGGRGAGKSFAAMNWCAEEGDRLGKGCVFVFLGRTLEDAQKNLIDGESGIMNFAPPWLGLDFKVSDGLLTWRNGARAYLMGADVPGAGRGGNFNRWWIDDLAAFGPNGFRVFKALDKAFRLRTPDGSGSRGVATTTPPGDPPPGCPELVEHFLEKQTDPAQTDFVYSVDASDVNLANLTPNFRRILDSYAGSPYELAERKGVYDKTAGPRVYAGIDFRAPPIAVPRAPAALLSVAVWIDPALSTATKACEVGIVAVGRTPDGHAVILEDASGHMNALEWPGAALDCLERWRRFAPVGHVGVETNRSEIQPEALLTLTDGMRRQALQLQGLPPTMPVRIVTVHTSKTKAERAAMTVDLYRGGWIQHVPGLLALEAQLVDLSDARGGTVGRDRADAAVYGLLEAFGILDKVRPGAGSLGPSPSMPVGAFGGGAVDSIALGPQAPTMTMRMPGGAAPLVGAFGRSTW